MAFCPRFLPTAVVVAGLAIAPAGHTEPWHGHAHYNHDGNNAGAAIVGGLIANNTADDGGGIFVEDGTLNMSGAGGVHVGRGSDLGRRVRRGVTIGLGAGDFGLRGRNPG